MKQFPKLIENQVAILWSEYSTGHVLDINFNLVLRDDQEVYLICESFTEAFRKATSLLNERNNIECTIYDQNQNVLKYLPASSVR